MCSFYSSCLKTGWAMNIQRFFSPFKIGYLLYYYICFPERPNSLHGQSSIDHPSSPRQRTLSQMSDQSGDIPGSPKFPRSLRDPLRQMSMMSSQSSLESESQEQTGTEFIWLQKEGRLPPPPPHTHRGTYTPPLSRMTPVC